MYYLKFLLLFLCCCIILSACKQDTFSVVPEEVLLEDKSNNMGSLVLATEKDTYPVDTEKIMYSITNYSDDIYYFTNETFYFEYYKNNSWDKYPFSKSDNGGFTYEAWCHELKKNETSIDCGVILKDFFDTPMKKGYYRIVRGDLISEIFLME